MKIIHEYGVDNIGVSSIKRKLIVGQKRITLHHTVRDGHAQTYWFSVWFVGTGYLDFDVRDWHAFTGNPESSDWTRISDKARLEIVAAHIEGVWRERGIDFVEYVTSHAINRPS